MFDDNGSGSQEIDINRDEFVGLKFCLAAMRGLIGSDTKNKLDHVSSNVASIRKL
jgi:hypothetical protein